MAMTGDQIKGPRVDQAGRTSCRYMRRIPSMFGDFDHGNVDGCLLRLARRSVLRNPSLRPLLARTVISLVDAHAASPARHQADEAGWSIRGNETLINGSRRRVEDLARRLVAAHVIAAVGGTRRGRPGA
jgi:hypothetical protein